MYCFKYVHSESLMTDYFVIPELNYAWFFINEFQHGIAVLKHLNIKAWVFFTERTTKGKWEILEYWWLWNQSYWNGNIFILKKTHHCLQNKL